jgi:hypothetical protein
MNIKHFANRFAFACSVTLVLLAGCQKKEESLPPEPMPAPKPAKPALVSAVHNSFDEVTAKLDKGGNFYLYLSTEQVLTNLSDSLSRASNLVSSLPNIPGTGRETLDKVFSVLEVVVKESGISEISGVGMSSIAREPELFYNKSVVHHYPGQNAGMIWTFFGKASHPLTELDLLPETTALAVSLDFDLPLLWTNIQQVAQTLAVPEVSAGLDTAPGKFKELTGLDLDAALNSFAGEYGVILTLDQTKMITIPLGLKSMEIPTPALCLLFKVNSNLIFDRVDQVLKGNPLLTKVDEPDLKMRTMTLPLPLPLAVRPSLARVGDYMLLASTDDLVREIVDVKSGKKKGFKTTDGFKRLAQGVPSEGNNFALVTSVFGTTMAQVQKRNLASSGMDPEALKKFDQLFQAKFTNAGAYSVSANGPDGWVATGNGASQGATAVILPAVAVGGLLAAIAIPNFVKARATSQENACINNLRLIDASKQQWALENKKQSTDTPTAADIQPYMGRGAKGEMPVCPAGGVYTIGSVGEKPTCSQPGHVLP